MKCLEPTSVRADAGTLRAHLRAAGYIYLPGFLPGERVAAVGAEIAHVLQRHGWLRPGTQPTELLTADQPVLPESGAVYPCFIAAQAVEALHRLAHDPALVAVSSALLGTAEVAVQPRKSIRMVQPRYRGFMTAPHQDFLHVQGHVDTVTAWVPLADSPLDRGGLRLLASSHHRGVVREGSEGIEVAADDPRWHTAHYRPGDVVLFHSLTVHASLPNTSDRIRISCDFRYQPADSTITALQTLPIDCPGAPDNWAVVTRGWTTPAWVSPDAKLRVEPYREPSETTLYRDLGPCAAEARLVDVKLPGSTTSVPSPRPALFDRVTSIGDLTNATRKGETHDQEVPPAGWVRRRVRQARRGWLSGDAGGRRFGRRADPAVGQVVASDHGPNAEDPHQAVERR